MSVIAIHQPNYLPWLGYFRKIAQADRFVFLDDAQFSKQGYINRVQVLHRGAARWLTIPVSVHLGDAIRDVPVARADWAQRHLDSLRGFYGRAAAFARVWPSVEALYDDLPGGSLAAINRALIERVCANLGWAPAFVGASEIDIGPGSPGADDRLVALVRALDPAGTYLSGKGGDKYQDPAKFSAAGLGLAYTDFRHPTYDQGGGDFVPGLSILDAVFHLGWAETRDLLERRS